MYTGRAVYIRVHPNPREYTGRPRMHTGLPAYIHDSCDMDMSHVYKQIAHYGLVCILGRPVCNRYGAAALKRRVTLYANEPSCDRGFFPWHDTARHRLLLTAARKDANCAMATRGWWDALPMGDRAHSTHTQTHTWHPKSTAAT